MEKNQKMLAADGQKKNLKKVDVERPNCVKNYNIFMEGVDLYDRMIALYRMKSRTNKWTIRTIFHFVDMAIVNSWILYKIDCESKNITKKKIMSLLDFRFEVARSLIVDNGEDTDVSDPEKENSQGENKGWYNNLPPKEFRKSGQHLPVAEELNFPNRYRREGCKFKSRIKCDKLNL